MSLPESPALPPAKAPLIRPADADTARLLREPPGRRAAAYLLAVAVALVGLFGAAPAVRYLSLGFLPAWAQGALLLATVTLVYAGWVASLPDRSTVWVGMFWFALMATAYAMVMAILITTPSEREPVFNLQDVRRSAVGWCVANVLLQSLLAYMCGALATNWRRSMELLLAARGTK